MNNKQKKVVDLSSIIPPITLAIMFLIMIVWSWRKWPDILVDFGRELYIPWQINSGQILYKDLAHLFGPFSSYFNAFLFNIFGTSYYVLIVSNIVVLSVFLATLYILLDKISSRWAAFMSCAVIISVFAFSQYVFIGNYNFISPYSHEATHGIVLSLLMIYQLYIFVTKRAKYCLVLAGLILGFIFLTKAEIFLSAFATAFFFFVLLYRNEKAFFHIVKEIGVFSAVAFVPFIGFLIYFGTAMPVHDAAKAILSPYCLILNSNVTNNPFYMRCMGVDDIKGNLLRMIFQALAVIITISAVIFLSRYYVKYKNKIVVRYLCIVGLAVGISMAFFVNPYNVRSIPIISVIAFLILLIHYLRLSTKDREQSSHLVPLLLWSVFSILVLGKIILSSKLFHYGFCLTLPSVVLLITMLIWFIPEWMDKKGSGGYVFRNTMIIIIIVIVGHSIMLSNKCYKVKSYSIGSGSDRIVTFPPNVDSRIYNTAQAIEWLRLNVGQNETFIVLPEGVMLNYLTKRINPTRYTNFMMPEILAFGEDTITRDFTEHPSDYIVLVHKNTSEYGVGYFGSDPKYGRKIMSWINQNYTNVLLLGKEPLVGNQFGIKILRRLKGTTPVSEIGVEPITQE